MTQDHVLTHLLFNNVQWSEAVEKANPGFFARLAALSSQEPKASISLRFCFPIPLQASLPILLAANSGSSTPY